ncbi:unnamed protein product [Bursaphelenchus xylophilus]|uniref:(pine wood nematode) hypothetical protein n=1 Tax=Bursaphelenchus xylophilus TaxID=6326 RepID=A0A1I7S4Q6_BURXY|nr:unnamed protein product [Bursaphelenchus xylophilus]CAG9117303.1 unnamed protein product [Bursaphelenchus xylophilus]
MGVAKRVQPKKLKAKSTVRLDNKFAQKRIVFDDEEESEETPEVVRKQIQKPEKKGKKTLTAKDFLKDAAVDKDDGSSDEEVNVNSKVGQTKAKGKKADVGAQKKVVKKVVIEKKEELDDEEGSSSDVRQNVATNKAGVKKAAKVVKDKKVNNKVAENGAASTPESAKKQKKSKKTDKTEEKEHKPRFDYNTATDRTVFVGNVKMETKRKTIEKLFKPYGEVEACYKRSLLGKTEKLTKKMFGTDKKLNKSVKDATFYVRFVKAEDAKRALEVNGTELDGRILRVTISSKKQVDSSRSVFVGNLRREVTEQELFDFVKEHIGAPEATRIVHDKFTGFGKGIGFITFKDASQVPLALNLTGQVLRGRPIRVTKIAKKNQRPVAQLKDLRKKGAKIAKKQEENNLKQKLANYTITKKTQIAATTTKKISKKARKVIQKKKNKKSKSLLA